uniref:Sprouty related EVH1 domain containing 3 n=1 Tax=Paramormyrops kingsleyae TaxID=1676925 RepID=A0A3B3T7S9_9TELE|nr:sprouty-related, EVH1 domain-containing protein 3-like [Paramormyrops kingsleyae]
MERDVVRVRAVVMTRDDSSGGWVPLGGGGLSHVVICKGQSQDAKGHAKYFVRGERLRDRAPVLDCAVQRGLVYNKVNPIFHHWRVEERKFGLTFQSPADAVSFESGLRSVIDWMDRGTTSPVLRAPEQGVPDDEPKPSRTDSESSFNSRKETLPKPITIVTSESSSTFFVHPPVSEDLSYGMKHTVTAQTPAMVHIMPLQHQPSTTDASRNPAATQPATPSPLTPATPSPLTLATPSPLTPATPSPLTLATPSPLTPTTLPVTSSPLSAPPLPLLDHGDLKDLWGVRGYEDYRRAEMRRTAGEGGLSDKSELCAVHFEKDLARVGVGGAEVAVMLDSKLPQRLSAGSPTCISAPNAVTSPGGGAGCPPCAGLGSPLPCCIHTSIAKPRSRSWKRGGGARGGACTNDCGLSLGLFGLSSADGTTRPADGTTRPADGTTRPADDTARPPTASSSPTSRCIYCRSVFSASDNGRGRCQDAPDPALHCLRQWTCVWCAESLLYHCTSDPEGEFWEPCSCEELPGEWPHAACCVRWVVLLALSLLVPCMCCYLPLCACLRCGEQCGCCGGKHKAVR